MENPFKKIFKKHENLAKGAAIGAAMMAAVEGSAQTNQQNDASKFINDNNLNPKWNIDMSKYPGMHPSKAFELDAYNKLDLQGKIEFTKQALEAAQQNLDIDIKMGEKPEQIKEDRDEIKKLEKQLEDLENQNSPAV